jgi:hypothetical protein
MDFGEIPEITLGGAQEPAREGEEQAEAHAGGEQERPEDEGWGADAESEQKREEDEGSAGAAEPRQEKKVEQHQHQQKEDEGRLYSGSQSAEDDEVSEITMTDREVMGAYRDLTSIPVAIAERYGSMATRLDLSYNMLRDVVNLEQFTQLKELVLDNNEISENITFPTMPSLHSLSLNKCQIKEVDRFLAMVRERLPSLTFLSLIGNEACPNGFMGGKSEEDYNRYRLRVLFVLPNLKFLDSRAVTPKVSEW